MTNRLRMRQPWKACLGKSPIILLQSWSRALCCDFGQAGHTGGSVAGHVTDRTWPRQIGGKCAPWTHGSDQCWLASVLATLKLPEYVEADQSRWWCEASQRRPLKQWNSAAIRRDLVLALQSAFVVDRDTAIWPLHGSNASYETHQAVLLLRWNSLAWSEGSWSLWFMMRLFAKISNYSRWTTTFYSKSRTTSKRLLKWDFPGPCLVSESYWIDFLWTVYKFEWRRYQSTFQFGNTLPMKLESYEAV